MVLLLLLLVVPYILFVSKHQKLYGQRMHRWDGRYEQVNKFHFFFKFSTFKTCLLDYIYISLIWYKARQGLAANAPGDGDSAICNQGEEEILCCCDDDKRRCISALCVLLVHQKIFFWILARKLPRGPYPLSCYSVVCCLTSSPTNSRFAHLIMGWCAHDLMGPSDVPITQKIPFLQEVLK